MDASVFREGVGYGRNDLQFIICVYFAERQLAAG
jgi:hypothetical protein